MQKLTDYNRLLQNTEAEKHEIVDETLKERSPVGYSNVYGQPLNQR